MFFFCTIFQFTDNISGTRTGSSMFRTLAKTHSVYKDIFGMVSRSSFQYRSVLDLLSQILLFWNSVRPDGLLFCLFSSFLCMVNPPTTCIQSFEYPFCVT